jgi:hypothetical protein
MAKNYCDINRQDGKTKYEKNKIKQPSTHSAIKKVKGDAVWCFCLPSGMSGGH